ncbi:MAG: phage tail tape measure protein [Cyanobacteria bacterium P01_C01_bin.121]
MSVESLSILISAIDEASKPIAQVADQIERLEKLGNSLNKTGGRISDLGESMSTRVTAPIIAGMGAATAAAISYESAFADVNKVMGFTEAEASVMSKEILQLSRTLPVSAQGLAEIAAAGGQLGTAKDDLIEFTELTGQMAIAFDMTAGQAGESIGELKNVYGLTLNETELLGDTINQLSNNAAANASDIVNAAGRIGGTAQQFGLTEQQTAALATTLIAFGAGPERASTAINGMLPMLQTATGQGERFQEGLAEIGMSAQELEQAISKDAMGGFQQFVDGLGALDSSTRAGVIQDMFGSGSDAQLLGTLAQNAGQLQKNLDLVGDTSAYAGSMFAEFEARAATTENGLLLMKNALGEVFINIGNALLPGINSLLNSVIPLTHAFAEFAANNQGLVKVGLAIAGIVAAVGPLLIIVGKAVTLVGALASAWAAVQSAMMLFAGVLAGIGTVSLGPILLIVGAIAAAAYLIIANWEQVKLLFQQIGTAFMTSFAPVVPTIQQLWANLQMMVSSLMQIGMAIVQFVAQLFNLNASATQTSSIMNFLGSAFMFVVTTIFQFAAGLVQAAAQLAALGAAATAAAARMVAGFVQGAAQAVAAVRNMGSQILAAIQAIAGQAFSAGAQIVRGIAAGITSQIGAVTGAIGNVANAIRSALPGSPVKEGVLRVLNNPSTNPGAEISRMIAAGITAGAPAVNAAMAMLGNQAIAPSASPQVSPLGPRGGGSGDGGNTFIFEFPGVTNREEAAAIGDDFEERVRQVMRDEDRNNLRVAY